MPRTRAGKGKQGTTPVPFDLGAHRLPERYTVAIVDPNGAPTPMVVTLASRHSREFRRRKGEADRAWRDSVDLNATMTPEQAEEFSEVEILHTVVAQTVDWSGFVLDGAAMPCEAATVEALYTSPGMGWLYEQVANEAYRRERFFVRPDSAS